MQPLMFHYSKQPFRDYIANVPGEPMVNPIMRYSIIGADFSLLTTEILKTDVMTLLLSGQQ